MTPVPDRNGWLRIDDPDNPPPKDFTEIPCLTPSYEGPVMLRWLKNNGIEAWHDWDNDSYSDVAYWFRLPDPPEDTA